MAVVGTNLTAGVNATGASSYTTASITPTANALILASFTTRTGITADPTQPTLTGCGLTWVVIQTIVFDNDSSSRRRITLFRGLGASPSTGALTFDEAGQAQTAGIWAVDQFTGVDTTGTNGSGAVVQSGIAQNTPDSNAGTAFLTVTLAAFSSVNNATYGVCANEDASWTVTVGSGMTQLASTGTSGATNGLFSQWQATNNTTPTTNFNSQSGTGMIALEINASGGVASTFRPKLLALLGIG